MMSSKLTPILLALLGALSLARAQAADGLVMNTPTTLSTCQNASLSWDHAAPGKIYITIVPGGKPSEPALVKFDEMDSGAKSLPWLVDLPAGTSVTVMATDSTGATTGSAAVTIQEGVDSSCVGHGQSGKQGGSTSSNSNQWTNSGQWTSAGTDPKAGPSTSPASSATDNSTKTTSAADAAPADKAPASPLKNAANSTSSTHNAPADTSSPSKADNKTADASSPHKDDKKTGSLTLSASVSSAPRMTIFTQEQIILSTGALLASALLFGTLH